MGGMIMKLWIARNQDGSLWLHEEKALFGI